MPSFPRYGWSPRALHLRSAGYGMEFGHVLTLNVISASKSFGSDPEVISSDLICGTTFNSLLWHSQVYVLSRDQNFLWSAI